MQLGWMYGRQGRDLAREAAFRAAVQIAPQLELASMGLFYALLALDRHSAAYDEMVRYLGLRDSDMYRELLCDGYEDGVSPEHIATIRVARALLAKHRRN